MEKLEEYRRKKEEAQQRKEKREKNFSKLIIVFMAVVVLGAAVYFFCVNGGWSYFKKGEDAVFNQETEGRFELSSSDGGIYKTYGDLMLACDKNEICAYNADGKVQWRLSIVTSDPIVDVCEKYVLVADRGGKSVYIIKNGKKMLEYETAYSIANASVNRYGSFVTITEEDSFKNLVCVRNITGKEFFTWHSANSYIIDAAISDDEASVMMSVLATHIQPDGTREYKSGVKLFDMNKAEEISNTEFDDSIAASVMYNGSDYVVLTNKSAIRYDEKGKEKKRFDFEGVCGKYALDNGKLLLVTTGNNYKNTLIMLDKNLSLDAKKEIDVSVDAIDLDTGVVAYLTGDEIYMCKSNFDVRYRIKTDKLYTDIELFTRGKRVLGAKNDELAVIKAN